MGNFNMSEIEEILLLTWMDNKIDRLSENIVGVIENDRKSMPASVFEKYKAIMVKHFDKISMKKSIRDILLNEYDELKIGEIINLLNHPRLKEISRREEYAKSSTGLNEMQRYLSVMQKPSEERKRLIEQVDEVKCASSMAIDTRLELFQAITYGMRGLNEENQEFSDDKLKQIISDMRKQGKVHAERQVWMGMLYAYKDISDSELKEYIALHKSSEGKLMSEFSRSLYLRMHTQVAEKIRNSLEEGFSVSYA